MRADLALPSVKEAEPDRKKRPIQVKFEIPYFTTSGIQVRYLKIIEPKVSFRVLSLGLCIPVLHSCQRRADSSNTFVSLSCNTRRYRGSGTSRKVETSPSVFPKHHNMPAFMSLACHYCSSFYLLSACFNRRILNTRLSPLSVTNMR
jgi:hypothetical protein